MGRVRYFEYEGDDAIDVLVNVMIEAGFKTPHSSQAKPKHVDTTSQTQRVMGFQPNEPDDEEEDEDEDD